MDTRNLVDASAAERESQDGERRRSQALQIAFAMQDRGLLDGNDCDVDGVLALARRIERWLATGDDGAAEAPCAPEA